MNVVDLGDWYDYCDRCCNVALRGYCGYWVPCGWSLVGAHAVLVRHPKLSRVEMVYIFIYIIME